MAVRTRTKETASVDGGDARIEDILDSKGVTWKFHPKVPTDQFDAEGSLHNQVRFEPVDHKVVEEYAEAMKRGDKFPPVIAYSTSKGFLNADGNHRLQAAIRAKRPLALYELIDARPEAITLVASEINARHGKPSSEAERIQQALYLIENGATIPVAAAAVNLPRKVLEKAAQRSSTDMRFRENEIAPLIIEKLAESVKWRLASISTDAGFKAAVELAYSANLSTDQVWDLVTRMKPFRDSDKQVAFLKEVRADVLGTISNSAGGAFTQSGNLKRVMGPRAKVGLALSNVLSLPSDMEFLSKQWTGAERTEQAEKMRQAAKRLSDLADALG